MTTTDTTPPAPAPPRVLRRSRTGRVGAGVAAGLGDYFGLDPVLFRVLFAISSFFGGAGVIAYLVAWAAIPDQDAPHAPIDSLVAAVRRRNVPPWAVIAVLAAVLWLAAASWWAPAPLVPAVIVFLLVLVAYGRRTSGARPAGALPATAAPTAVLPAVPTPAGDTQVVDLTKSPGGDTWSVPPGTPADPIASWFATARAAARERRHRAQPVRLATLLAIVAGLGGLAVADAVHGVALPLYFAVAAALCAIGLGVGLVLHRTPWSLSWLLVAALVGLVGLGGSSARLHDGIGQATWSPATTPASSYRLAIGNAVLDLRGIDPAVRARTVHVTMATGQVRVLLPKDANVVVRAEVRFGSVEIYGARVTDTSRNVHGGYDVLRTVQAPAGATGARVTVVVRLADGNVSIDHR